VAQRLTPALGDRQLSGIRPVIARNDC
jgi:hypothetical protein